MAQFVAFCILYPSQYGPLQNRTSMTPVLFLMLSQEYTTESDHPWKLQGPGLVLLRKAVLTQRDSVRELIFQVKDLAEGPQELQNHQSFSKELSGKSSPHWNWTGQLLVEPIYRAQLWVQIKDLQPTFILDNHHFWFCSVWFRDSSAVLSLTFRSSHSMSSLGLFHSFSRSAYFFFSSFSFSRSCESNYKHQELMILHTFIKI